jgi:hypothetical protein
MRQAGVADDDGIGAVDDRPCHLHDAGDVVRIFASSTTPARRSRRQDDRAGAWKGSRASNSPLPTGSGADRLTSTAVTPSESDGARQAGVLPASAQDAHDDRRPAVEERWATVTEERLDAGVL